MNTVILCAGGINHTNLPIHSNQTNAMVPVNGKPVIGWVLDDLIDKNFLKINIVVRADNEKLIRFLERSYSNKIDLRVIKARRSRSILESLNIGLKHIENSSPTQVILGDTLIKDPFGENKDMIYIGSTTEPHKWCIVFFNDQRVATQYINKEDIISDQLYAVSGYYLFQNTPILKNASKSALQNSNKELSDVLKIYGEKRPIVVEKVKQWYDFGHLGEFISSKKKLLKSRYFNSIKVDPILNTLTKNSLDQEKLQNELRWYQDIPDYLKIFTPRLIIENSSQKNVQIVQEYLGYPTLAELFVFGELGLSTWQNIINYLIIIHQEFSKYKGQISQKNVRKIYGDKTWDRLSILRKEESWNKLFSYSEIVYNGKILTNIDGLKAFINQQINNLLDSYQCTVLHGDYYFGNILYDLTNQIVRLVDPRGSFGEPGIYGDPRYDIAKLRHSVSGQFDFIVADMFELSGNGNIFKAQMYINGVQPHLQKYLDHKIVQSGYSLSQIKFIEGLLFISMIPLHKDFPNRQKLMYLTGLQYLNELYENSH